MANNMASSVENGILTKLILAINGTIGYAKRATWNQGVRSMSALLQQHMSLAQVNLHDELLAAWQEAITSFVEELEREIGTNSSLAQSLKKQSSATSKLQEQVDAIIEKEKWNTKSACSAENPCEGCGCSWSTTMTYWKSCNISNNISGWYIWGWGISGGKAQ